MGKRRRRFFRCKTLTLSGQRFQEQGVGGHVWGMRKYIRWICHSVTFLTISTEKENSANRAKHKQIRAFQEEKQIWFRYFLCATAAGWGAGNWRHLWGRTGQTAAFEKVGYYGFTTSEETKKEPLIQALFPWLCTCFTFLRCLLRFCKKAFF